MNEFKLVGEVTDHDSHDHNGQQFMVIDWTEVMLPVGTKLYILVPESVVKCTTTELHTHAMWVANRSRAAK